MKRGIDMPVRGMVNNLVGRRMKGRPVGATKAMGAGSTPKTTPQNPALSGLKHSGKAGIPGRRSTAGIGGSVGGIRNVINQYSRVPIGGGGINALPPMPQAPPQGGAIGQPPFGWMGLQPGGGGPQSQGFGSWNNWQGSGGWRPGGGYRG